MDPSSSSSSSSLSSSTTTTTTTTTTPSPSPSPPIDDDRVFLVPHRWLRESLETPPEGGDAEPVRGILYTAAPAPVGFGGPMKIINTFFNSDLVFNLRREDDEAVEGVARTYALVRSDLWEQALKWHSGSFSGDPLVDSSLDEDGDFDVYAIMLRITVQETSTMTVKISKKDNLFEVYKRASKIFSIDSEKVHIWDFSGQTTLIVMNEKNKLHRDVQRPADSEIILQLHVYSLLESLFCPNEGRKDDHGMHLTRKISCCGGQLMTNGGMDVTDSDPLVTKCATMNGSFRISGNSGLTGLENLGNTCFMNSALQCLTHTPKLVDFFLGDYRKEINHSNPLGTSGELALAFGELLRKLWSSDRTPVAPKFFKSKLARFAPQFSGFNQHDSQELLAFLLDGLHEDLNRVRQKPYIEVRDALDRPHEEVADEYWQNHLARNDSIIVETCQGQYRSTLVCPSCNKVSVTFDPFMYLSLPLPSSTTRTMTLTVFSTDGSAKPSPYTISVPKHGMCSDLIQALSVSCSLREDEVLLVAEVYSNKILRFLEDPSDSISLIRDGDRLAAYRVPKESENSIMVVFMHQQMQQQQYNSKTSYLTAFGVPLLARLPANPKGSIILDLLLKLLHPFAKLETRSSEVPNPNGNTSDRITQMDGTSPLPVCETSTSGDNDEWCDWSEVELHVTNSKGQNMEFKIEMEGEVSISDSERYLHVFVTWPKKILEKYDISLLSSLPEVHRSGFLAKWPQDSISLYACLDSFLKEEPLGPEDMWYCPSCKTHRQASKKLDLWRLPEVLVIHLKRFSYSRYFKNKLESFVDFPISDLDLSSYIAGKNQQQINHYELFAISNHYGSMGGGHYTAYVHHPVVNQWFDFDDRRVASISMDNVKTSAAYVLFYKRVRSPKDA